MKLQNLSSFAPFISAGQDKNEFLMNRILERHREEFHWTPYPHQDWAKGFHHQSYSPW